MPSSSLSEKWRSSRWKFDWAKVFGECHLVLNLLQSKSECSPWLPVKVVDAVLRGFSQVVFANHSVAGLAVIVGLALADVTVCAAGVLAATVATLTSLAFRHSWQSIGNGLMTYNGVLVGTVTASLCPPIVAATNGPDYLSWCLIVLGAIMSALVTSGLGNLCKGVSLPPMTVPFNLIDLLIFICLPSALTHLAESVPPEQVNKVINATQPDLIIDWLMVLRGSFVSMGQIWAVEDVTCSLIMYSGIILYSPLLAVALFGGSLIESVCALGLTNNYAEIYSGLWGYNGALTAGAIATVFYVPTVLSAFNAVLASVFTAAAQRAFALVLAPAGLPILTIPFVVTSSMFLAVSSGTGAETLIKAPDGRPPECQRVRYNKQRALPPSCDV